MYTRSCAGRKVVRFVTIGADSLDQYHLRLIPWRESPRIELRIAPNALTAIFSTRAVVASYRAAALVSYIPVANFRRAPRRPKYCEATAALASFSALCCNMLSPRRLESIHKQETGFPIHSRPMK